MNLKKYIRIIDSSSNTKKFKFAESKTKTRAFSSTEETSTTCFNFLYWNKFCVHTHINIFTHAHIYRHKKYNIIIQISFSERYIFKIKADIVGKI